MKNPKSQTPSTKEIPSPKFQRGQWASNSWRLVIGDSLGFGDWRLGFLP